MCPSKVSPSHPSVPPGSLPASEVLQDEVSYLEDQAEKLLRNCLRQNHNGCPLPPLWMERSCLAAVTSEGSAGDGPIIGAVDPPEGAAGVTQAHLRRRPAASASASCVALDIACLGSAPVALQRRAL